MSDKERKTRADAHYRAAARYMKSDVNDPRAKAHLMRWGALRFGALDVDPRLESYATMLGKYKEFSVIATRTGSPLGSGMTFPNNFHGEARYEQYRRGEWGSKVMLEHFVKREGHGWGASRFGSLDVDPRLESYATMLRKYKEFSVYASDDEGRLGSGMEFPNRSRSNDEEQEVYEQYRRGLNGSKVRLDHFVRH